ncbi:riboflavin synthase [Halothermothrix orenii]|uniref:Riboflavin synthase n=1 Tax=Halothermothrix orenii (strain H 168 / OCM 544 / DSM 9562) TaxID=373903 RepID=B8CWT7_HALOH|nr:riboflavin synthase [Halothermothrix orenii]ACL69756.1 riboflavin synthase, alpha subunit [Halothermothrix orenii H 168]
MFTGIIQEIGSLEGKVRGTNKYQLTFKADKVLDGISRGDSIAVNGVCLTVVKSTHNFFTADVMPETLEKTNLGLLKNGDRVNLEQAMKADGFFGGHLVQGHIDGTGNIIYIKPIGNARVVGVKITPDLEKYMVDKGSIALNGVSLTIVEVDKGIIEVSLIPETWNGTIFQYIQVGDEVNIEVDVIGKYVVNTLEKVFLNNGTGINREFLRQNGFL